MKQWLDQKGHCRKIEFFTKSYPGPTTASGTEMRLVQLEQGQGQCNKDKDRASATRMKTRLVQLGVRRGQCNWD